MYFFSFIFRENEDKLKKTRNSRYGDGEKVLGFKQFLLFKMLNLIKWLLVIYTTYTISIVIATRWNVSTNKKSLFMLCVTSIIVAF